jgi:hypothetical protein
MATEEPRKTARGVASVRRGSTLGTILSRSADLVKIWQAIESLLK